jgi:hypothetical protein
MQYAVNGSEPVILCQGGFYAIANGVWFAASSPMGPWTVATAIPDEIYTIPPSSPLYNVTFAYVGYADTNQVEAAYLPGYVGSYGDDADDDGGTVYGTGYYYEPWAANYYYGWGWPYGYDYQYRWWDSSWLWRPAWNRVGNPYAVNAGSAYDNWPRAADGTYAARAAVDRAAGVGYPTTYGRFAGATRAVPMSVPARASLVDPYAKTPASVNPTAASRAAEQTMQSLRVGSDASRDLYASPDGNIYRRQDGKWYQPAADGHWAYVAPAVGPETHPYHPATMAAYDRPVAARPAAAATDYRRPPETAQMDQDYQARAMAERSYQQSRPEYRGGGGRR